MIRNNYNLNTLYQLQTHEKPSRDKIRHAIFKHGLLIYYSNKKL